MSETDQSQPAAVVEVDQSAVLPEESPLVSQAAVNEADLANAMPS